MSAMSDLPQPDFEHLSQIDGNDTTLSDDSVVSAIHDLPQPIMSDRTKNDLNFSYTLNAEKQSERLITNAQKATFSVIYKNLKKINGISYNMDAVIQFNAGTYLTAVKSVLETVYQGWTAPVEKWALCCTEVSNRTEKSSHLVDTKLVLLSSERDGNIGENDKLTLHLYHTKSKILVQSHFS